jgi:ABC-type phosphate/phosphonate transport system substrate-binding protein
MRKNFRTVITLCTVIIFLLAPLTLMAADTVNCWFPPSWKAKQKEAQAIAKALSSGAGLDIRPQVAGSYPEILTAFSTEKYSLVYVGSFVQAIINARKLGTPLVQKKNGKEMYSGIMVYPRGGDPAAILKNNPDQIAFTRGASSGESSAKAATGGMAAIGVKNHGAAAEAVVSGKAVAAVVKNWWWEGNKAKFPGLDVYEIPGVSLQKNPDNVLTASKAVPQNLMNKITVAAIGSKMVFGKGEMVPFDVKLLSFSLELMKKGGIDPMTYSW